MNPTLNTPDSHPGPITPFYPPRLLKLLDTENYVQAAQLVLDRATFTPRLQLPVALVREIDEALTWVLEQHPERFIHPSPHPKRSFEAALRKLTETRLRQLFPEGYGGQSALKAYRRKALEAGRYCYETNFDALEAQLDTLLEQGEIQTLGNILQHSTNPYTCKYFELKYHQKLPRTQKAVRALLEARLPPEAISRGIQKEAARSQVRVNREIAFLEDRMKTQFLRSENGTRITLLEWGQDFLDGSWELRKVRHGQGMRNELHQTQGRLCYHRPFAVLVQWLILKGLPQT